jgi:branched-chain amino acid aminotransferase
MKIWIDGRITGEADARIPVTDHGLLYGDGVFEGMRIYDRRVFRLRDHLRRLEVGASAIGLELPGGTEALSRAVLETARAHGQRDAYVRLIVTRGSGPLGVDPTTCAAPRVICIVGDIRLYPPEKRARGLDMVTVSLRRPTGDVLDPRIKSLNYLNSVLAKLEARQRGADEALILNQAGHVAEAAVANVFAVQDGVLTTPPCTDGALGGITRRSLLEIAEQEGIPARERTLGRFDLLAADEVFLSGSGVRLMRVASLDGRPIGRGPRAPVLERLDAAFAKFVEQHGTPVPE